MGLPVGWRWSEKISFTFIVYLIKFKSKRKVCKQLFKKISNWYQHFWEMFCNFLLKKLSNKVKIFIGFFITSKNQNFWKLLEVFERVFIALVGTIATRTQNFWRDSAIAIVPSENRKHKIIYYLSFFLVVEFSQLIRWGFLKFSLSLISHLS